MGKVVSMRAFALYGKMATSTVRFYEKIGVIKPKNMLAKGYDLDDIGKVAEYRMSTKSKRKR